MDRVTLNAVNGASINGPSSGNDTTLTIIDTRTTTINNFIINGCEAGTSGNDVVDCGKAPVCVFNGVCEDCTVAGIGSESVHLEENSVASLGGKFRMTGNAGAGVSLWNGSNASFLGGGRATSNNSGEGDMVCNPHYTTVSGSPDTLGMIVGRP